MKRGQSIRGACALGSFVGVLALGGAACGPVATAEGVSDPQAIARSILGGAADATDDAVMALVHQMGTTGSEACSGTTVGKVGASGFFLTAGHCVVQTDGMGHISSPLTVAHPSELYVLPGPDWVTSLKSGLYYGAAEVKTHPQYDGSVNSPFDIALVRYVGTTAATQAIPPLSAADDKLAVGSAITVIGFGKTETNTMNSQRRKVERVVETLATQTFAYSQTDLKGACQGDSGGPALVPTAAGPRVAGVTSFGDPNCTVVGSSVRVSPMSTFLQAFVDAAPKTLSCGECTLASVGPGNACVSQGAACGDMSSVCGEFLVCANACQTQACVSGCRGRLPSGAAEYDAMLACQCGNGCASVCATNPVCASLSCGGLTDSRPGCATCLTGHCCAEAAACGADASCASCTVAATSVCRANAVFAKLNTCLATCASCTGAVVGAAVDAGVPTTDASEKPPSGDAGCGCSLGPSRSPPFPLAAGLLLNILVWLVWLVWPVWPGRRSRR